MTLMIKATRKSKLLMRAGAAALVAGSFTATAHAQSSEERVEFNIPSQSLEDALRSYGVAADRQMMFSTEIVEGKTANALSGDLAPFEALEQLLDGSGLVYETTSSNVILIKTPVRQAMNLNHGEAMSTTQAGGQGGDGAATGPSGEGQAVAVTGRVTDVTTGANLKGALVTLEPTGETTSTDDLGRYRFRSVAPGTYSIRVSYLGYEGSQESVRVRSGQAVSQDFQLGGDVATLDTIVVFGQRSARAQSLNQERTAPNSTTVLAADILGQFNGTTISEALRRAPGVAFEPDPNTGDGANVILRGLEPDLNQIQLNGLRLLDGSGLGRSADLSGILTESIESVVINKSLLPSQDSNGAGGLVEIETKSPLDRDRRFASFGLEYGQKGNDFGDELLFNGTVSGTFGDADDFGVSLSVSYREQEATQVNYRVDGLNLGQYLPLDADGNPLTRNTAINPLTPFPFEPGVDEVYPAGLFASQGDTGTELLSLTGAMQKQFGNHTDLRLDVTFSERRENRYTATTRLLRIFPGYYLAPVEELGGEIRGALVSEDPFRGDPFFQSLFGTGIFGTIQRSVRYLPELKSDSFGLSFRGDTVLGRWSFGYNAGFTRSTNGGSERYDVGIFSEPIDRDGLASVRVLVARDQLLPRALDNVTGDGRIVSIFDPLTPNSSAFVLPLFSDEAFAFYNTLDEQSLSNLFIRTPSTGESDAITLDLNAKYDFDHNIFRYVDVGVNYQDTSFDSVGSRSLEQAEVADPATLLSQIGFGFGPGILTQVGAANDFDSLTRGSVEQVVGSIDQLLDRGDLTITVFDDTTDQRTASTDEATLAGYVEGQVDFGKLEVIGGVRVESYEIESTFFTSPTARDESGQDIPEVREAGQFVTESVSQTDILPRILANYRFSENMLLRAGFYTTVSRPRIANLTNRAVFQLNLRQNPPFLLVTLGNPELEPAVTYNFNADWEWYTDDVGVMKLSAFYKRIQNPLQRTITPTTLTLLSDDFELPDLDVFNALGPDTTVRFTQPVNGETDDEIWGLEASVERQFTFLPGLWGGFGVFANYTYTDSSSTRRLGTTFVPEGFVEIEGVPFDGSPRNSGTIGLTYNKYNIDASLFYSAQDRRLTSFNSFFVHDYAEAFESLDFRADYYLDLKGADVRVFVRGENLLEGDEDPRLQTSVGGDRGVPIYNTGATYFGGRSFFVGLSTTF